MDSNELKRLEKALENLIDSENKRIAQREEEKRKLKERELRRKQLYAKYYGSPSAVTMYFPKDSSLLNFDREGKKRDGSNNK